MRLKERLRSPWMLPLIALAALLLMADYRPYRQEGVTMTAVEGSVMSGGMTIEILNTTDRPLWNCGDYDRNYRLQRGLLGLWLPMRQAKRPAGEVCAAAPVFYYEKDVPQRFAFKWSEDLRFPFTALEPGSYRLILDFYEDGFEESVFQLAAEFTVE